MLGGYNIDQIRNRWGVSADLLHCVSSYPAPIDQINLAVLRQGWCSGLSDHSRDLDMGMMAVCAGAKVVETHFRLYDCDPVNPDYPVAFDPGELAMYVGKIRKAERALGDGVKRVQPSEEWALPYRVNA
jgi:N,N'-diacetyllegionaminate synthase